MRTVYRKPWPRRDEHGAGTTVRTSTPAIILVEVVKRGNPDRDEIDGMEWHLGADGDVQADLRLHGHTAAVGVKCVGAFQRIFRSVGTLSKAPFQDPRQLRWKRIRDRCALPAVPVVANLMNGYIEERGVCF